ncbi:MAG: Holliday junction branch migration protein RuvA [Treponema sp.]|nr:Holliday junction branch migration protein RuvA [Treponema sp.]
MFNSLTGIITGKYPQKVFLDTHGIEWDINVPDKTLDALPATGEKARVFIWMQHTDALMLLYGFSSDSERNLFLSLLKVDGIGPKAALKIMSNVSVDDLLAILENGDVSALSKIPGVGKKTASKMLLSLKGKLNLDNDLPAKASKKASPYEDVIVSLSSMGYDRRDCEAALNNLVKELEKDPAFAKLLPTQKEDTLFRRAIVELAK